MCMYIKLLDEKIWNVSKLREDKDIMDVRYFNDLIMCVEVKTGTVYYIDQKYNGEEEPTWIKAKRWQVDDWRHQPQIEPDQIITENDEYDDYLVQEIEENNRYYVEDDLHGDFNAYNNYKDTFSL